MWVHACLYIRQNNNTSKKILLVWWWMHRFFYYYILLHRSRKTEIQKCLVVKKSCHMCMFISKALKNATNSINKKDLIGHESITSSFRLKCLLFAWQVNCSLNPPSFKKHMLFNKYRTVKTPEECLIFEVLFLKDLFFTP
jgi:hypothetical protein